MMEAPTATFTPDSTVGEAVESIRDLVKHAFVTYLFVVDSGGHLVAAWGMFLGLATLIITR